MIAVLRHYWENYSDPRPNPRNARRAGELLMEYLGDNTTRVGVMTRGRQRKFMKWLSDRKFSTASISRHMSIIGAAVNFAATPQLIKRDGEEVEVLMLKYAPKIFAAEKEITEATGGPATQPRTWIPTDEELAGFIDALGARQEHVFRYTILALNTWARPQAIMDLDVPTQVDFRAGTIELNPPGRTQTKKHRPHIRLTNNLRGWLEHWGEDRPIQWAGEPVADVKKAFERATQAVSLDSMSRYTLRHYMASRVRSCGVYVPPEQRDVWLGHSRSGSRTASHWYETKDPEYLRECAQATDAVLANLDKIAEKSLFAPKLHPKAKVVRLKRKAG